MIGRREKREGSVPRLHHVVGAIELGGGVIDQGLPPLLSIQREGAQGHHLRHRTGGEDRVVQAREENVRLPLPLLLEEDNQVAHPLLELEVKLRGLRQGHPQLGIQPIRGIDQDQGVRDRDVGLGQSPGAQ